MLASKNEKIDSLKYLVGLLRGYLLSLGCINLDGGSSTTTWIKNKDVVNFSSENNTKRPVSNALLIFNKAIVD